MANSNIANKLGKNPKVESNISNRQSIVGAILAAIKNQVKKYRETTQDQVYMSSNFKLDN